MKATFNNWRNARALFMPDIVHYEQEVEKRLPYFNYIVEFREGEKEVWNSPRSNRLHYQIDKKFKEVGLTVGCMRRFA